MSAWTFNSNGGAGARVCPWSLLRSTGNREVSKHSMCPIPKLESSFTFACGNGTPRVQSLFEKTRPGAHTVPSRFSVSRAVRSIAASIILDWNCLEDPNKDTANS